MSEYRNYYIGYQTADKKVYPIGPFDSKQKLVPVFWRSRSFASDFSDCFCSLSDAMVSDELKQAILSDCDVNEGYNVTSYLSYCPLNALPSGDFIKRGYCLIDSVTQYLDADESDRDELLRYGIFENQLSEPVYAAKLTNELLFLHGSKEKCVGLTHGDDEADDYEKSCQDYMYFCYPDYTSKEYDAFLIRNAVSMFETFKLPENAILVAIQEIC